jgi:hypothetical protein
LHAKRNRSRSTASIAPWPISAAPVLVALIGMGEAAAGDNTETIFQHFRLKALRPGRLRRRAGPAPEGGTGGGFEQFSVPKPCWDFCACFPVSISPVSARRTKWSARRKSATRYARATNSQVADMETEAVADVVRERQIPFMAVRAISDDYISRCCRPARSPPASKVERLILKTSVRSRCRSEKRCRCRGNFPERVTTTRHGWIFSARFFPATGP